LVVLITNVKLPHWPEISCGQKMIDRVN